MQVQLVLEFYLTLVFLAVKKSSQVEISKPEAYRLCVPSASQALCDQMITTDSTQPWAKKIKCVIASGKIGCIEKVIKNEADFLPAEPEEVFVAQKYHRNGIRIIGEIRQNEYMSRDYRYEPVAIIRISSNIKGISDLRGKKSCHTGFGKNAGWKVPFSHLLDKNELTGLCGEIEGTTTERDLNAFSKYFAQACAPGPWVPEKDYDATLRNKYSKLCQLCKSPRDCNSKDDYAGYEGALKCLTENDGDVAWTKMDAVQKFFKLNETTHSAIVGNYAFLCWDGSSQPLTSPNPCSWAKRPWSTFLASRHLTAEAITELQETLKSAVAHAKSLKAVNTTAITWDMKVLEVNATSQSEFAIPAHLAKATTPYEYLRAKNYTVTIEKPSCASTKAVRICVTDVIEKLKCIELQMGSLGRRIVPGFDCILGEDREDCFQKVHNGQADVVVSGPKNAAKAKINFGLVPILDTLEVMDEGTNEHGPYRYALAVIRNDSDIHNMTGLRGKKSCHGTVRNLAGWNVPLSMLKNGGVISGPTCGLPIEMAKFFNASCVPGVFELQKRMPWVPSSLCALCAGDSAPGDPEAKSPGTFCEDGPRERYYGARGSLRCLADQVGDVAFVNHVALLEESSDIIDLKQVKLLCPQGQVMDVSQFRHCHWGRTSSFKVLAKDGDANKIEREDARLSLLKAADLFSPVGSASTVVPLFGKYYSNKDVLFKDSAVGLANYVPNARSDELINAFDFCQTSSATRIGLGWIMVLLVYLMGCYKLG